LQIYLRASDVVVLPYIEILNSGAAILALSFSRPVLVPARGALIDLREEIGRDWVMTYEHELTPAILRSAAAWAQEPRPERAPLGSLDWEPIRDLTAAIFREVASAAPRPLAC
jgi:beta-1,4-mannosyltransferase